MNTIHAFPNQDRFAQELLTLLSRYPEILAAGRDIGWGVGCGDDLRLKLLELAKTEAEHAAAQNVVSVDYRYKPWSFVSPVDVNSPVYKQFVGEIHSAEVRSPSVIQRVMRNLCVCDA